MSDKPQLISYKEKYKNKIVVVKFGGALSNDDTIRIIAEQVDFIRTAIRSKVIVVHGGGLQIDEELKAKGIEIRKDERTGLRITDAETLEVTDNALRRLNGKIVRIFNSISSADHSAIGLSGYDHRLLLSDKVSNPSDYTGCMVGLNKDVLTKLMELGHDSSVPILYPVCFNRHARPGQDIRLNVNADDVAAHVASFMGAERLIICSDIDGVKDKDGKVITEMSPREAHNMIANGTVTGGMIPKLTMVAKAAETMSRGGVAIVNGFRKDAILGEILTKEGRGTLIRNLELDMN